MGLCVDIMSSISVTIFIVIEWVMSFSAIHTHHVPHIDVIIFIGDAIPFILGLVWIFCRYMPRLQMNCPAVVKWHLPGILTAGLAGLPVLLWQIFGD